MARAMRVQVGCPLFSYAYRMLTMIRILTA